MKEYYSPSDFIKAPKFDAHIHYHTFDDLFVRKAKKTNMFLIAINTDFHFLTLDKQIEISQFLHARYPETFNYICSFDATKFASKTFAEDTIEHIKKCMATGARGVKIWKNIGMDFKNETEQYLMVDDPVFEPIFTFLEKEKIPLLAHLGEPRNCWLPIELMTIDRDRGYFIKNPDFHMYLHPEVPSYEQQIIARDNLLERYPEMIFVGAHLGSMEWNLEEVAKRLDRFSNFYIDVSERFHYIMKHTFENRNLVIDFFETYRNRILYGSDHLVSKYGRWKWLNYFPQVYMYLMRKYSYQIYKKHWLFFATDKVIKTKKMRIKGLKLQKDIVDCIFYKNIQSVYFNK